VQLGAVAFVLAERILRKLDAKVTHDPVARYFCNDAGGGDAQAEAVPVDDRRLRKGKGDDRQTVDQHMIRWSAQRFHRGAHGAVARTQNVDAIDLHGINNAHRPAQIGTGGQLKINFLPQLRSQLFGIVQAAMTKVFWKNYRCGDYRTRQSPAPGLIDPGNARDPGGAQFFFITKPTTPAHVGILSRNFRGEK
jgi:hypothetical protein